MHPPPLAARAFQPSAVRLLDSPFLDAQRLDGDYLLSLDPDRMLGGFRSEAGLVPRAEGYGGWERQGVAGHTAGHLLSALSIMHAATGEARFRERLDDMVAELAACQDAHGDGYVGAIPDGRRVFAGLRGGTVEAQNFMLNGVWVPWYTIHKLLAGLVDAHRHAGSTAAKDVVVRLADWVGDVTVGLSDGQFQEMLRAEHGGMSESLADVYAATGDGRHLALAQRFTHRAVTDPLADGRDELDGLHANTQVPKIIAAARLYALTGDDYYRRASGAFWGDVVDRRSWAQGGNSDQEHFFPPGASADHLTTAAAESCNVYNMLRLTAARFEIAPSRDAADYYERALFNQVLGGVDPKRGMFTYFQSMRPGGFKVYSDPENAMWCCVGTGMENPARYGEAVYFHGTGDNGADEAALWVNLFIPSVLTWEEKGVTIRQETAYPAESTTRLAFTAERPTRVALRLRVPAWVDGSPALKVNGESRVPEVVDGYAVVDREWSTGDRVEWTVPMAVRAEPLEQTPEWVAFLYGPVALAGQLGTEGLDDVEWYLCDHDQNRYATLPAPPVPALVGTPDGLAASVVKVEGDPDPLTFGLPTADGSSATLRPFAGTHFVRYTLYWRVFADRPTHDVERERLGRIAAAEAALDARTTDRVRPGEQQPEVDHHLQSERSRSGGRAAKWRDASDGGFFQYDVAVDPDADHELRVTYSGDDGGGNDGGGDDGGGDDGRGRAFDLLVDGTAVAAESLTGERPGELIEKVYAVPRDLTAGKRRVTVRFQARPGRIAGGVFGLRVVRAE